MKCPVCEAGARRERERLYDDRYGYSGWFELWRCPSCGHRFVPNAFEPRHLGRLYTQFYPRKEAALEEFRAHEEARGLRAWWQGEGASAFRWVPENVRVLDIGCGFGQTLAYHAKRGCDAWGVEADENVRRFAERFGLKVDVGLFVAARYEPGSFDFITLDQVVEHATDPRALLRGVAQTLKPRGTAVLTTPNASSIAARLLGRSWLHWHVPYHLQFFTPRSMRIAAESAGLEVVGRRTVTPSAWLHYQWLHLFSLPLPGEPSAFWVPGAAPRFFYRRVYRLLALIHRLQLNHLGARLLDALSLGDNQVFFLRRQAAA